MANTISNRQQKFRDGMKEEGKMQRTFFLSEEAMDLLRKFKDEIQAQSLNHALEYMLTAPSTVAELLDKIFEANEEVRKLREIAEQAKLTSAAYRNWMADESTLTTQQWKMKSRKLAEIIDPLTPISKQAAVVNKSVVGKIG